MSDLTGIRTMSVSTGSRTMSDVVLKVKYEETMIRFKVSLVPYADNKPALSLHGLKSKIFDTFKLKGDADRLNLTYTDGDGDAIAILNEEHYLEAFSQKLSRIYVQASFGKREISFDKLGPFGGGEGWDWDDGKFEGINGITISTSSESLLSIQVTYATGKAATHNGARHGGKGSATYTTNLRYPEEKLQKISGCCGLVESKWTVIKSLSFETNVAKYGPFGVVDGVPFEFDLRSMNVVGFYGRASSGYMDSIGLHTT